MRLAASATVRREPLDECLHVLLRRLWSTPRHARLNPSTNSPSYRITSLTLHELLMLGACCRHQLAASKVVAGSALA